MPHVIVKFVSGKPLQQQQGLADAIARDVKQHFGYDDDSISVAFDEVPSDEWKDKVYQPEIVEKADQLLKKPGYTM